jgi:hypothetical protein
MLKSWKRKEWGDMASTITIKISVHDRIANFMISVGRDDPTGNKCPSMTMASTPVSLARVTQTNLLRGC